MIRFAARCALVLAAMSPAGCSEDDTGVATSPTMGANVVPRAADATQARDDDFARCVLEAPTHAQSTGLGDVVALVAGPLGARALTEHGWFDAGGSGTLAPEASGSGVWVENRYVYLAAGGVASGDLTLGQSRLTRALSPRACDRALLPRERGALLLYREISGSDCAENDRPSRVYVQPLDAQGVPQSAPRALDALPGLTSTHSGMTVRRDAGRTLVVVDDANDNPAAWVLDSEGNQVSQWVGAAADADEVLCARSGCATVSVRSQGSTQAQIQLRDIGGRVLLTAMVSAASFGSVSVDGDLVAVTLWSESTPGSRAVVLLDVTRRALVPILDRSAGQSVTEWQPSGTLGDVVALGRGSFALSGSTPGLGPWLRRLHCSGAL